MAHDLLIQNRHIIDSSGIPGFRGDVGVKDGKIVEIGKLGGQATRVVDVAGMVIVPGFIDNHCHCNAQVSWDPPCSLSCDHGATRCYVMGDACQKRAATDAEIDAMCSASLAPASSRAAAARSGAYNPPFQCHRP